MYKVYPAKSNSIRILHITDHHLFADAQGSLLGVPTWQSLEAVLDLMAPELPKTDLILVTGDVTQDHTDASYQAFAKRINQLQLPVHYLPGNHDALTAMHRCLQGEHIHPETQIQVGSWALHLLNSAVPGKVSGAIAPECLDALERAVAQSQAVHHLVALHHHPVPMQSTWLDAHILEQGSQFLARLNQISQIKLVLFGHVHQEYEGQHQAIKLLATPSTSVQFTPHAQDFEVDSLQPGYRVLELFKNGHFETKVDRVLGSRFVADAQATGYD